MATEQNLTRIVKMTLRAEEVNAFLAHFEEKKEYIRAFPGCNGLRLIRSVDQPNILFTYSHWADAADLEAYRHSELFKSTWTYVKTLFEERAEAWSAIVIADL